jgi:outer membrane protein OmpA-like peptidoglycan-associated protein
MVTIGMRNVAAGANPMGIKRGIERAVAAAVESIQSQAKDVDDKTKVEVSRLDAKAEAARARGDEAYNKAENAEKLARGKVVWEVTLNNDEVKFGLNQAKISDSAQAALDDIAQRVKSSDHAVYVEIQGHTDNTGSAEYNMNLGQKRADAVRRYLGDEAGIPLHLITAISYGEDSPVADNKNKDGRAQNRRVVIRILE